MKQVFRKNVFLPVHKSVLIYLYINSTAAKTLDVETVNQI